MKRQQAGNDDDVDMSEAPDAVPKIARHHFNEAFQQARKSVKVEELAKYDEYRRKMDPAYAKKADGQRVGKKLNWPEMESSQFEQKVDDDDLYS